MGKTRLSGMKKEEKRQERAKTDNKPPRGTVFRAAAIKKMRPRVKARTHLQFISNQLFSFIQESIILYVSSEMTCSISQASFSATSSEMPWSFKKVRMVQCLSYTSSA